MFSSKKGQTGGLITGTIITVITVILLAVVGTIVIAMMTGNIDRSDFSADANTTYDKVVNNGWTAMTLVGVLIIIVVGVAMIGVMLAVRQ